MPILTEEERVGTLVAGRYRLEGILGRGGTGVVFEAVHTWTGRRVAVKLLRPEYARDLALVRRFLQEARTAAGLEHPNVIQVLDMGAADDGSVYLVLELLRGQSLTELLERKPRLSPSEALDIVLPVLDALGHAHRQGIIHRDLKPDNIFLRVGPGEQRIPTLLDFGMAYMIQEQWGHATQSGTLVGTPFYMSPEQAQGEAELGPAADVWSIGVILYRCLTGELPFSASTPTALLLAIVQSKPVPVCERAPDVPESVGAVVDRAIVADRDERYADVEELATALRHALSSNGRAGSVANEGTLPDAEDEPPAQGEVTRSRRWFGWVAISAAGILLGAMGLSQMSAFEQGGPSDSESRRSGAPPGAGEAEGTGVTAVPPLAQAPETDAGASAPQAQASASASDSKRTSSMRKGEESEPRVVKRRREMPVPENADDAKPSPDGTPERAAKPPPEKADRSRDDASSDAAAPSSNIPDIAREW